MPQTLKTKHKLPFGIFSSSVNTGYNAEISSSFQSGIDITNLHGDNYASFEDSPAQGPFTEAHVGGNQHRHVPLNTGSQDATTRSEAFIIDFQTPDEIRVYGPEFVDTARPRASMLRGNAAKRPVNIENLRTTTGSVVLGNYTRDYEIVQTSGRRINNRFLTKAGDIPISASNSAFIIGLTDFKLPDRDATGSNKFIFVERFNAPGSPEVSSRGALDVEAEEVSPYNALPFRNLNVRLPLREFLTQHTAQFGLSSLTEDTGSHFTDNPSASFHKVNRNSLCRPDPNDSSSFETLYDNWYVQHAIPQTDIQYHWITASAITTACELAGYSRSGSATNRGGAFTDIVFVSGSETSGSSIDFVDHIGISPPDKDRVYVSEFNQTMFRDKRVMTLDGADQTIDELKTISGIDLGSTARFSEIYNSGKFTLVFWIKPDVHTNITPTIVDFGFNDIIFRINSGSFNGAGADELSLRVKGTGGTAGVWNTELAPLGNQFTSLSHRKNWTMVAVSHDVNALDNEPVFYVNAEPQQTIEVTPASSTGIKALNSIYNVLVGHMNDETDLTFGFNGSLSEFSIWKDVLSPREIEIIYGATKDLNEGPPRQYDEHRVDREYPSLRSKILSWHSGHGEGLNPIENVSYGISQPLGLMLLDVADKNNYHGRVGDGVTRVETANPGSFSSWGNGAFGYPGWKQIRTGDNPVARYMKTKNLISVQNEPKPRIVETATERKSFFGRRGVGSTIFKEPMVTCKYKPMEHALMLKGSVNPLLGFILKHTYCNNLSFFANKSLNQRLSLLSDEEQMYDKLYEYYTDPDLPEEENPVSRFLNLRYSEVVYPKEECTFLGTTRGRTEYIVDESGRTSDGYDVLFGDQRAFWRDKIVDRHRTVGVSGALNSQRYEFAESIEGTNFPGGIPLSSSLIDSNGDLSLFPLDVRSGNKYKGYGLLGSFRVDSLVSADYGGELNHHEWFISRQGSGSNLSPSISLEGFRTQIDRIGIGRSGFGTTDREEDQKPRVSYLAYLYGYRYDTSDIGNVGITSSLDSGLQWRTAELAGKNPWFDSYDDYAADIRYMGKEYSVLPEFRVSEHMEYFILDAGGNFRQSNNMYLTLDGAGIRNASALEETNSFDDKFFKVYAHSDLLSKQSKISSEHRDVANVSNIKIKCNGIKKLLPYNGFYPVQRTVQLASLLSQSIGSHITGGYVRGPSVGGFVNTSPDDALVAHAKLSSLLQPFYAPGIMYNSIKSGIAVDFPVFTGSAPVGGEIQGTTPEVAFGDTPGSGIAHGFHFAYDSKHSYRISFESLIFPNIGIPSTKEIVVSADDTNIEGSVFHSYPKGTIISSANRNYFMVWDHQRDFRYELAASNFVAEVPKFFLKDQKLSTFASEKSSKWDVFDSTKTYYMDVVLKKTDDFVMIESFEGSNHETGAFGQRTTGKYFGFPSNISRSIAPIYNHVESPERPGQHADPAYAAYTPPYHEGEAIARLSFTPGSTKKYTLDEIFIDLVVENVYAGFLQTNDSLVDVPGNSRTYSGSIAHSGAMPVDASINYRGKLAEQKIEFALGQLKKQKFSPDRGTNEFTSDNERWAISSRWECPTLNFINQERDVPDEVVTTSSITNGFANLGNDFSGSGFGRGMWSGYGELPTGSSGIFLELRDSFPQQLKSVVNPTTASLLEAVGFQPSKSRIGELADEKEISEAIIAIPFLENSSKLTVDIDCKNLIKIDKTVYDRQKLNFDKGEPAVKERDLGSTQEIGVTSISDMIDKMEEYVLPPQFNFLEFEDIAPFVMYIFEFKHSLDKQDLSDIWQGVMPKIAMIPEKDEIEIDHPTGKFEFFGEVGLPDGIRWMVFKVKKKAEKNYFAVTADSTDDDRFKFDFEVGRKAPDYSYNWPYDYFSLVELGKLEVELTYNNRNDIEKLRQSGVQQINEGSTRRGLGQKRGLKGKGKKLTK